MEEHVEDGSNYLHRLVEDDAPRRSFQDYVNEIESLLDRDYDIDAQDSRGKTPLCAAVDRRNDNAVKALLACGADVNVVTIDGDTVISRSYGDSKRALEMHVYKVMFARIDVIPENMLFCFSILSESDFWQKILNQLDFYKEELANMVEMRFQMCQESLYDLLKADASMITRGKFRALKELVESSEFDTRFPHMGCLLKMQYRKAALFTRLREGAEDSLAKLLGMSLPSPCIECLLVYLNKRDLKNLIAATSA